MHRKLLMSVLSVALLLLGVPGFAVTPTTRRVSVNSSEVVADQGSYGYLGGSVSADGRFVVFESSATNLVPSDTNGAYDVFIRDRMNGTTRRVSVKSNEGQATGGTSYRGSISADGRFVVFNSYATNLVPNDTNGAQDVFVRDRLVGTTRRISVNSAELEGNGASFDAFVSASGRFVVFSSDASNLVGGDTNAVRDVFLRDRERGITRRISVRSNENQGNAGSQNVSISGNGRFVAFASDATNLVGNDTNAVQDIFLRDRVAGTTRRISVDSSEVEANGDSTLPKVSADGRFVVYDSGANNLVAGDLNGQNDVFIRNLAAGSTKMISLSSGEAKGNDFSGDATISANGRFVSFDSGSTNLVAMDTNAVMDVFLRDRVGGTTRRVSVAAGGSEANAQSYDGTVSGDGRFVVFNSQATNLVLNDTNGLEEVFIRGPLI